MEPKGAPQPSKDGMRRFFLCLVVATVLLAAWSLPPIARKHPAMLQVSTVAARPTIPGYERTKFGAAWATPPQGPCNTRVWMLKRSLSDVQQRACSLTAGWAKDPYSGVVIGIGEEHERIEVDHVFPLSAAWDLGAAHWPQELRVRFANDPINLIAVSRTQNQAKGDQLPSEWLPPKRSSRCWYAGRLAAVAVAYGLPLPEQDLKAMRSQCILPP